MTRRVLVLGAGQIGRSHASAVVRAGDAVAGIVDVDPARAAELAATVGAAPFATLEAGLEGAGADLVVIATPSTQHLEQSLPVIAAGLDVLVEKPHRVPGESPRALRDALAASASTYSIGMTTRHWPGMRAAAEAFGSGELGDLLSYSDRIRFRLRPGDLPPWYFDRAVSGGGILLTNGVHAIDRMRAILGEAPGLDSARLETLHADHRCEDSADLRFTTSSGAPADIGLSWPVAEPVDTGLVVVGTKGSVRVDQDGSWRVRTASRDVDGPALGDGEPFVRQWEALRAGDATGFGLDDLEPTLELIERIYREHP